MFAHIVVHHLIFKTKISRSEKAPSAVAGMELVSSATIILRLSGKYWRSYAERFFQANQQEVGTLLPSAFKESCCLMTPCCNEKLFPFFRAGALQLDYFKSSRKIHQLLHCFAPKPCRLLPGPVAPSIGLHPRWMTKLSLRLVQERWGCVCGFFFPPAMVHYFQEEMDCAGAGPEAALSLPGSQMHGHIAWLSLARLGKLQQV